MKKTRIILSFMLIVMLSCINAFADATEYATATWEEVTYKTFSGEMNTIRIKVTGLVGVQLDEKLVYTPNIDATLIDTFAFVTEDGKYDVDGVMYTAEDFIKEFKDTGVKLNVLAVVEGSEIIIEQVSKKEGTGNFESFPGGCEYIGEDMKYAISVMGQVGEYGVGANSTPRLEEGQEVSSVMLDFPVQFNEEEKIVIVTVSEAKAKELLEQAKVDMKADGYTAMEEKKEEPKTEDPKTEETSKVELGSLEIEIIPGDTLALISARYYGDYSMIDELYSANAEYFKKTGDRLNVGETIVLPKEPKFHVPVKSETTETYTVKAGDSLGSIAVKFYKDFSKYELIYKANKDRLKNKTMIYVGQVLEIPKMN